MTPSMKKLSSKSPAVLELTLLFLYTFCIFPCIVYTKILWFDKAIYLSFFFRYILSERLSNNLWGSGVLLFSEFINLVYILYYNFIEIIKLLYTFLVIYFARYKEYIIWWISFSKFSDVLPAFTRTRAIGNLWIICLGVNILSCLTKSSGHERSETR